MKWSLAFLEQALPSSRLYIDGVDAGWNSDIMQSFTRLLTESDCDVSVDSRTIKSGHIFLALPGEKYDGHKFLLQAVQKGAKALIINAEQKTSLESIPHDLLLKTPVLMVRDTLETLITMAKLWRARFDYPVVGITGSMGKTSTKEMLRSIAFSAGRSWFITDESSRNVVDVCMQILKMKDTHTAAVIDMDVYQKGEMSMLADIVRPSMALITALAHHYTDSFESVAQIAAEKRKIFAYFKPDNIGMVFGDDTHLASAYYSHPVVRFGSKTKNHIQARKEKTEKIDDFTYVTKFDLKVYKDKQHIQIHGNNPGGVSHALGAATISSLLNIPFESIVQGLQDYRGTKAHFFMHSLKSERGILIDDSHEANPESMRAALLAFHAMTFDGLKIAILGDMDHLGEKEIFWHRQIGRVLSRAMSIDHLILVGKRARAIKKTIPITMKATDVVRCEQAEEVLNSLLQENKALVLVKESGCMKLYNLVNACVQT